MAPLGDVLVLFGGSGITGLLADTWTWNGTVWSELEVAGPSPREDAVMAPLGDELVLFGGWLVSDTAGQAAGDTWVFDGASFTQLDVAGPPARADAVMVPFDGRLVLFGGQAVAAGAPSGTIFADTWTFDGTAWTKLDVSGPPARLRAMMAVP
jgi:N-acetylneuraminic acid mutarotase